MNRENLPAKMQGYSAVNYRSNLFQNKAEVCSQERFRGFLRLKNFFCSTFTHRHGFIVILKKHQRKKTKKNLTKIICTIF